MYIKINNLQGLGTEYKWLNKFHRALLEIILDVIHLKKQNKLYKELNLKNINTKTIRYDPKHISIIEYQIH